MLLTIDQHGGIVPRIKDPVLLPKNKSQIAVNADFEEGGVRPIKRNLYDSMPGNASPATIFRYYGNSENVFFTWVADVNAIKAPIPADAYNRVFYTENGKLRVTDNSHYSVGGTAYPVTSHNPSPPAPAAAPTVAGTPSGPDPTLLETRAYVYTYVNSYGAEGPPSLVSNLLSIYDGNPVTVSGMTVSPGADWDILYKRIYRLNQASGGFSQYQFVAEIPVAQTSYSDTVLDSALSEILATTEWDPPPDGITGLIALPNGVCAAFAGNTLCLSVPGYPHAWPAAYQKSFDRNIVGIGAFGTTVVVATEGSPYVNVGNDPATTVSERIPGFSCMSKLGLVQAGEVVVYPSPEGLVGIGPTGVELITWDVITPDDWYERYYPSTIKAYYWQGKYIGFYTRTEDAATAGFIFDLKTKDLVDLDFYASAGFYDKVDGTLYLVVDGQIVCFREELYDKLTLDVAPTITWSHGQVIVGQTSRATAAIVSPSSNPLVYNVEKVTGTFASGEVIGPDSTHTAAQGAGYPRHLSRYRTLVYTTKRFKPGKGAFRLVKAVSDQYPVTVDIIYPKVPIAIHVELADGTPQRIKSYLVDEVELKIHGKGASIIFLASTMEEIPL